MGNMLLDMMGLLTRKKVTKTGEDQDFLVLGKTPKLDVDMMFTAPKMHNELIRLKDLKAYFDVGEISGSGSERTIPMFTASGDSIENSQLSQSPPLSNGMYQMRFNNCDRFFINKPSSVTGGDPEFLIKQDNNFKASFGWDDDGDGFAFVYNYSGAGIRLGAAGNNPVIEIKTTAGAEIVDIHKNVKLVDYGQGNKTGTATYNLSVDTDGNIIETAAGGTTLTGGNLITVSGGTIDHGTPTATGTSAGSAITLSYGNTIDPQLLVGQDPNNNNNGLKLDQFGHVTGFQSRALQMPSWLGITNVALNGSNLEFTSTAGAEGGFSGSVNLSSLSGSNQTLDIEDIKGAFYNVATLADLNNISDTLISDGQIVWVEAESATYQATITLADYINTFTDTITWNEFTGFQGLVETRGSWTPRVSATVATEFNISSYQIQQGHWVRHGNLVYCDFTIQVLATAISGNSGSTSALYIHGWPFDAQGAGATLQSPFLDFVDGFDHEVKSCSISTTTNDPAVIGSLRLQPMKQHSGITSYFGLQNLYAGDFNNGSYFRIFGSMTYYTTNTTLTTGSTQVP